MTDAKKVELEDNSENTEIIKKRKLEDGDIEKTIANIESSSSESKQKWNELFKQVFNNIVLFRNIFKHVRLYKKNKVVQISNRSELQRYVEREYIEKLIYSGVEMLELGDLPTGCVLKEIEFSKLELSSINGSVIPQGVEIIDYSSNFDNNTPTTPFSTLPPSIHSVNNAVYNLTRPPLVCDSNYEDNKYYIPPTIKSISFNKYPNISGFDYDGDGQFPIPTTISSIGFSYFWNAYNIPLRKGDIPTSITSLSMRNYCVSKIEKDVLPSSLKELEVCCRNDKDGAGNYLLSFDFMQNLNIQSLYIKCFCLLKEKSNLFKCTSINKLTIQFHVLHNDEVQIESQSLPPTITDLKLIGITNKFEKGSIPSSVKNLGLTFYKPLVDEISKDSIPSSVTSLSINKVIDQVGILPESLENLEFHNNNFGFVVHHHNYYTKQELVKMIEILPKSLKSLTLAKSFKEFSLTFPSTIKRIQYN